MRRRNNNHHNSNDGNTISIHQDHCAENDDDSHNNNNKNQLLIMSRNNNNTNVTAIIPYYSFHIISILLIICGVIISHRYLYTSEECSMTWSRRQFIEIINFLTTSSNSNTPNNNNDKNVNHRNLIITPYRLYKFFDARDPRHASFVVNQKRDQNQDWMKININNNNNNNKNDNGSSQNNSNNNNKEWCWTNNNKSNNNKNYNNNTAFLEPFIVLYVPGHYGSYQQARSLGAHGIQLTQQITHDKKQRDYELSIIQQLLLQNQNHYHPTKDIDTSTTTTTKNNGKQIFLFDLFAIDFQEEGGGYHGAIINRQADYIVDAIETITTNCLVNNIVIVAHSIGGISTLLASTKLYEKYNNNHIKKTNTDVDSSSIPNNNNNKILAIITLGSPLAFPVLTWSPSLYNLYHYLQKERNIQPPIISISGGLRDEMIPPLACQASLNSINSLSLITTDIYTNSKQDKKSITHNDNNNNNNNSSLLLGMDHRSIVWCHNVLSHVRDIIHTIVLNNEKQQQQQHHLQQYYYHDNNNNETKTIKSNLIIESIKRGLSENDNNDDNNKTINYHYEQSVTNLQTKMRLTYGLAASLLMETGFLYNVDVLVLLYTCIGMWYMFTGKYSLNVTNGSGCDSFYRQITRRLIPPVTAAIIVSASLFSGYCQRPLLSYQSLLVLSLAADSIFVFLRWISSNLLPVKLFKAHTSSSRYIPQTVVFFLQYLLGWILLWMIMYSFADLQQNNWLRDPSSCCCLILFSTIYFLALILFFEISSAIRNMIKEQSNLNSGSLDVLLWYNQQLNYAIWTVPTALVLSFDDLVVVSKGLMGSYTSILVSPIVMLSIPVCAKFIFSYLVMRRNDYDSFLSKKMNAKYSTDSRLRHFISLVDCFQVVISVVHFCGVLTSISQTWHHHQILHPISKMLISVALSDMAKTLAYVAW